MPDDETAARLIAAGKTWVEAESLAALLPKEKLEAALRDLCRAEVAETEVKPRLEKGFDAALANLRALTESPAAMLGPHATERIIEAAGSIEPDPRAVEAFFAERAVGDLLGSVLYDGIVEFLKKANELSELFPGMTAAKKFAGGVGGFLGALGGGLAGSIAEGMRAEFEKKVAAQVRAFLAGFGKVAVERAIRFANSPANRKVFRQMRMNLARKALEMPFRDLLAGLTPERAARLRARLVEEALRIAAGERETHRIEAAIERLAARYGRETPAGLATRFLGGPLPVEPFVRLFAPGLRRFLETDEARRILRETGSR